MESLPSSYVPEKAENELKKFGANIRRARKLRRLSMGMCCERAGISRDTLSRLEKGSPCVSLGTIAKVAWVLGETDALANLVENENSKLAEILEDCGVPGFSGKTMENF